MTLPWACSTIASSGFTGTVLVLLDCCLEYASCAGEDGLSGVGPVPVPSPCQWFIGYAAGEGLPAQFSAYLGTPCHFTAALVDVVPRLLGVGALARYGSATLVHRAQAEFVGVRDTVLVNSRSFNQVPWCAVYNALSRTGATGEAPERGADDATAPLGAPPTSVDAGVGPPSPGSGDTGWSEVPDPGPAGDGDKPQGPGPLHGSRSVTDSAWDAVATAAAGVTPSLSALPPHWRSWTVEQVAQWAAGIAPPAVPLLVAHGFDGPVLALVRDTCDFTRAGVPCGPAMKLADAVQRLRCASVVGTDTALPEGMPGYGASRDDGPV